MSHGDNTQGSGGAGTGSGSGSSSGSGTGTGNGGAGTGSGRTKAVLGVLLAVVSAVVGVPLLVAPLVDRWADPTTRPALYVLALLTVYAACMHAIARSGRGAS